MTERRVWEEDLWSSNVPLPSRPWAEGHPRVRELPRAYSADGEQLWPWTLHSLAPLDLERSWLPLPADHESVWLFRNGKVRHGLVDLAAGRIVEWRREGLASTWQPKPSPPPDPEARPQHQLDQRPRRRRSKTTPKPPSRKPTT